MARTNQQAGTRIDEIAERIYRVSTPIPEPSPGFSFNQILIEDEEPLLFHTGPRQIFRFVLEAIATVVAPSRLRHIAFSHLEADECGALNEWLAVAPHAHPVCSTVGAMVSIADLADRPPRAMADGERWELGSHTVRWYDAPHLPHGWDCGFLMEERTATLFCGDLFTQPGAHCPPLTEADILSPSEAFRQQLDYFSHSTRAPELLERLAAANPTTLACMHGSAWRGNGAELLRALARALAD
jgi:flavorubredoxin